LRRFRRSVRSFPTAVNPIVHHGKHGEEANFIYHEIRKRERLPIWNRRFCFSFHIEGNDILNPVSEKPFCENMYKSIELLEFCFILCN